MIPTKVVPAFPYEGALYWLFAERGTPAYEGSHSYYLSLYGVNHDRIMPRASALACLFDEIIMTPADAIIPSDNSLRVALGGDYIEWNPEVRGLAEELRKNAAVNKLITSVPYFADDKTRFHFLCRTIAQIIMADNNNAVLVGNSFFAQVYDEVAKHIAAIHKSGQPIPPWTLDLQLLGITGLDFGSADMDTFASIRQNKNISSYATHFRAAIARAASTSDLQGELLKLMKNALEQENIARYASGAFETIGSAANVAGLIPLIGSVASVAGMVADGSGRGSRKFQANKQWYLIGPKMKEVAIKELLEKI